MGSRNQTQRHWEDGMSMAEFDNEIVGNNVEWRIVRNEHRQRNGEPSLFVYRRKDRGDGRLVSEYLHTDGLIDLGAGNNGFFVDYKDIGLAMITHEVLKRNGERGGYAPNYLLYLERFGPQAA